MRRFVFVFPLAVALSFTSPVAAGFMWGYENPANTSLLTPGAAAGLTFPNSVRADGPADGRITATAVQDWSVAPATAPDRVSHGAYTFNLKVTDLASGQSGLLTFKGMLDGSIWKTGTSLTNTFTGPMSATVNLGANSYTVRLDGFTAPSGFGEPGAGAITADVTVRPVGPADTESRVSQTPEPGAGLLAGLALAATGLARTLRSRRTALPGE